MRNFCFLFGIVILVSCSQQIKQDPLTSAIKLTGQTMGTTYHITYIDSNKRNYQEAIDSLLVAVNQSMSTYDENSILSRFNRYHGKDWFEVDKYFYDVFKLSKTLYHYTAKTFNPAVMPLVNFWGFGKDKKDQRPDEALIDSLLTLVNLDKVEYMRRDEEEGRYKYFVKKNQQNISLDFSAIAKGYGVDVIARYLNDLGISNYMIEIGGEVRAKGKNDKGGPWKIGIDQPVENSERTIQSIVELDNMSMATSGNYRNFYIKDGKKYVHTINPRTGYPEVNSTLSVSVFAKECAVADAYATAFMVMGKNAGGMRIAESQKDIEAYFIYAVMDSFKTAMTEGLKGKIREL